MVKIPDATSIRRDIPEGQKPVASLDTRGVGEGLAEAAGLLDQYRQRLSQNELAKAEADFQIRKTELDTLHGRDTNFEGLSSRYSADLEGSLSEIAGTISDGRLRNEFVNKYRVNVAAGVERMKGIEFNLQRDHERAGITERLVGLRNAGLDGDFLAAAGAADKLLQSSVAAGWMDETEATEQGITFREKLAVGKLNMMPPEQRVKALSLPWAKNLPADTRAKIERDAQDALRVGDAQKMVDDFIDEGLSRKEMMRKARSIKDSDLRKEVESRFDYVLGKQEAAVEEERTSLKDKWYDDIALGDMTIEDIKEAGEWDAMGADLQSTMITAQSRSASNTKTPFNITHHDNLTKLQQAAERGDRNAGISMRRYFLKHYAEMSDEQQKAWSTASIKGTLPVEVKDGLTLQQLVQSKLPATSDVEKRRRLIGEVGRWHMEFTSREGRPPNVTERNRYVDDLMLEEDAGFFYAERSVFEMDTEEQKKVLRNFRDDEDTSAAYKQAVQYFNDLGIEKPTLVELIGKTREFIEGNE